MLVMIRMLVFFTNDTKYYSFSITICELNMNVDTFTKVLALLLLIMHAASHCCSCYSSDKFIACKSAINVTISLDRHKN